MGLKKGNQKEKEKEKDKKSIKSAAVSKREDGQKDWEEARNKVKKKGKEADSQYRKNWVLFIQQLAPLGLTIRTIASDGNCLFRSIADQLEGRQDLHMKYRTACTDYMNDHADEFAPFLPDEPLATYTKRMSKDG